MKKFVIPYEIHDFPYFVSEQELDYNVDFTKRLIDEKWAYYRWREDVERGGWKRNEEVAERIAVHGGLNLEICVGPGAGFAPATLMKNYNSNIMISDLCPTVVKEWYELFQNMENPPPNIEYAVFDVCDMPFVDTICSHYFGGVRMIKKEFSHWR